MKRGFFEARRRGDLVRGRSACVLGQKGTDFGLEGGVSPRVDRVTNGRASEAVELAAESPLSSEPARQQDEEYPGKTHLRGGTNGISTHVVPPQPVTDLQQVRREGGFGLNAVDRIASRSPNRTLFHSRAVLRRNTSGVFGLELVREGEDVRVHDLVIEHDRVE